MFKLKKVKVFAITASLSLLFSQSVFAASYTVLPGDTLYSIGKLFNTSAAVITQNNSLSSNTIYPKQVLSVPARTYVVKSGDSLYLIAKRYGVSVYSLRKANNLWTNSIYPGQRLNLPAASVGTSQTSGTTAGTASKSVIPYTAGDLDLLARLINAEAENQPYNAKVGVGAVVINRVQDSRFPNTLSSVIYQKSDGYYQFTPVENGWINKPATQESKNAAYAALHGSDPSNGAMFYFDDSATNRWLWSKPLAARIGNMVFVY